MLMRYWLLQVIKKYQKISPFFRGQCRFVPTCSEYFALAIGRFGVFKGVYLGFKRLSKCHPGYKGDWFDMVPELKEDNRNER